MIERVRHVKISVRIQRDGPRIVKLSRCAARAADDFHRLTVGGENLNPAVPKLADKNVPDAVHRQIVGITQFAQPRSRATKLPQKIPIRRKNLDPMIARIRHVKPVLRIHANPLRPVELPGRVACEAHDLKQRCLAPRSAEHRLGLLRRLRCERSI